MGKETIFFGTAVLIVTNFLVKLLSLFYRAVLVRLIGGEGLGLLEMITPFYSFLLVLASLGIPLALSNLISAENGSPKVRDILKTGTLLLLFNSLLVTAAVLLFFPFLRELVFSDERVWLGFLALTPTLLVISLSSALRGYFQGSHRGSLIGKSQVVEQVVRVAIGLVIVWQLTSMGCPVTLVLAGISGATLLAELAGALYLLIQYRRSPPLSEKRRGRFDRKAAGNLLQMGTPVTLSRLLSTFTMSCQALLIPKALLAAGCTASLATTLFGYFSGVALVVLHLPAIITGALTVPLIPAVAEAAALGQEKILQDRIHESLIFTTHTAFPLLALIFWFAVPICSILFASPQAGPMLSLLAVGGIFLYLQQPVIAVLQGLGHFRAIFFNLLISDAVYLGLLFWFYLRGDFSITTAIGLFILNDVMLCAANFLYLKHKVKVRLQPVRVFFRPLACSLLALFPMAVINQILPGLTGEDLLSMLVSSLLFFGAYLLFTALFGLEWRPYAKRLRERLTTNH